MTNENSYSKAVVEGEGIAMEISIPGYAVDYGYESVSLAGTNNQFGNFYRVVIQSSPGEFRYVTNYVEGESCQDGGIPAPCGGGWMMSETGDEYFVVTGMGDTGICDEIVRSIFVE